MNGRFHLVCVSALAVLAGGCSAFAPELVHQQRFAALAGPVETLAVLPFVPGARLSERAGVRESERETAAWEAASYVTRFVTEALQRRGVRVITGNDMRIAFEGRGQVLPRSDPVAAAQLARSAFGASAVVLGQVDRYRERSGSSYGSTGSASVVFDVTLYSAPGAEKIWTGRFDHSQQAVTSNLFTAIRYPSSGARFLTAAELARWGAGLVADAMPLHEP